jgi:hypothetical protein
LAESVSVCAGFVSEASELQRVCRHRPQRPNRNSASARRGALAAPIRASTYRLNTGTASSLPS